MTRRLAGVVGAAVAVVAFAAVALGGMAAADGSQRGPDVERSQPTEVDLDFELVASGLIWPVDIQNAADDRLFIVERHGMIQVLDRDGARRSQAFLDIRSRVDLTGAEMGLLGLAFHPDFSVNGELFVNYTAGSPRRTVISRFVASGEGDGQVQIADPDSEEVIVEFAQPGQNHNGGQLVFGPDGYLYISAGDGGAVAAESQSAQSLLGSVLRIDVDSTSAGRPQDCSLGPANAYRIPADNPMSGEGECGEIWLSGLRNPWRISFDSDLEDLWIGDVGEKDREEINVHPAGARGGANFGWPCFEGTLLNREAACAQDGDFVAPVFEYSHDGFRCSVTGGHVYRGERFPRLDGRYIFGEFCSDEYWTVEFPQDGSSINPTTVSAHLVDAPGDFPIEPSTFGLDSDGEMYVASLQGSVWRVGDPAGPSPTPTPTATPAPAVPEVVTSVSCFAGAGRVDVVLTNPTTSPVTYAVEIRDLSRRTQSVDPGASVRLTATGRNDGSTGVFVWSDGSLIALEFFTVTCAVSGDEATITSGCLWGSGVVDLRVRNPGDTTVSYSLDVGGLERDLTVEAGDSGRRVLTGQPNGTTEVTVRRDGTLVADERVTIACGER